MTLLPFALCPLPSPKGLPHCYEKKQPGKAREPKAAKAPAAAPEEKKTTNTHPENECLEGRQQTKEAPATRAEAATTPGNGAETHIPDTGHLPQKHNTVEGVAASACQGRRVNR